MLTLEKIEITLGSFSLNADLSVQEQTITAVIGPSGAGKSTLMSAIAGFEPISAGRILWGQSDLTDKPPGQRPVAMLFQDGNLFPHLSVAENVGLGLSPSLRLTDEDQGEVSDALAAVGLRGMGSRRPAELSGGQQSRVALARALVQKRALVILDEPFAALGPGLKSEMLDLTKSVLQGQGATVLMITHDPSDAKRVADQVLVVSEGRAQAPMPADTFFASPPAALQGYFGSTL